MVVIKVFQVSTLLPFSFIVADFTETTNEINIYLATYTNVFLPAQQFFTWAGLLRFVFSAAFLYVILKFRTLETAYKAEKALQKSGTGVKAALTLPFIGEVDADWTNFYEPLTLLVVGDGTNF